MGAETKNSGIKTALIMWGLMFLGCIIDKLALNGNFVLEMVVLILAPLVLSGWYVYQCIENNPDSATIKQWHIQYSAAFIVCGVIGYFAMMLLLVFVPSHSETLSLSGGGITLYGIPGLIGFSIFALIVQIIRKQLRK